MGWMAMIALAGLGSLVLDVTERVPTLKIEQACRAAADVKIAESQSYDGCVRDEMAARTELTQGWTTFTVADRARCSDEASAGGVDSYVDLLVCLQMSRDVEEIKRSQLKGARRK